MLAGGRIQEGTSPVWQREHLIPARVLHLVEPWELNEPGTLVLQKTCLRLPGPS